MSKYGAINSPRLAVIRQRRRRAFRKKIFLISLVILIILGGLSYASRIKKININNVEITGNKVVDTKDILALVNRDISSRYLWLFPKTNFLIFPRYQIKRELKTNLKRLKDVSVSIKNIQTLEVRVNEHEGKYLWCGISTTPILSIDINDNKCYFLDSSGYVFDEAPYFSGDIYFKFYGNNFDSKLQNNNPIGSYFLAENFSKTVSLKENLEKMSLKPSAFWLDENSEGNIAISKNITGPKIIFKMNADYEKLAENLQSAITNEPLKTELKTKLGSLLYIDLRFGNKVYYKFQ